jgi:hypothetical protein
MFCKILIQSNKYMNIVIICFLVVYILFYNSEINESSKTSMSTRTLKDDGFCVLYNPVYSKYTVDYPCNELITDVLLKLPSGYVFIDYIYKIHNASLSTFHRDVTSS